MTKKEIRRQKRKKRREKRQAEGRGLKNVITQLGISLAVGTITKNFSMSNLGKSVSGSPKTTGAGIAGFIALLATQAEFMLDGNPETLVNWVVVINAAIVLIMGLIVKDGDVSSKSIGLDED